MASAMLWIPGLKNNAKKTNAAETLLLSVRNLSVGCRTDSGIREILKGINFDLAAGETIVFTGGTGAGKTTLALSLIGRLAEIQGTVISGELWFRGRSFMKNGKYRRLGRNDIGMIFQDTNRCFEAHQPVDEQIAEMFRERRKLSAVKGIEAAQKILEQAGLSAVRGSALPGELSGGQRQMAAVAFILAKGSSLLLADENLHALDMESRSRLFDLLAEDQKNNGTGILFFSRNGNFTDGRYFRTLKLESGRLIHIS